MIIIVSRVQRRRLRHMVCPRAAKSLPVPSPPPEPNPFCRHRSCFPHRRNAYGTFCLTNALLSPDEVCLRPGGWRKWRRRLNILYYTYIRQANGIINWLRPTRRSRVSCRVVRPRSGAPSDDLRFPSFGGVIVEPRRNTKRLITVYNDVWPSRCSVLLLCLNDIYIYNILLYMHVYICTLIILCTRIYASDANDCRISGRNSFRPDTINYNFLFSLNNCILFAPGFTHQFDIFGEGVVSKL